MLTNGNAIGRRLFWWKHFAVFVINLSVLELLNSIIVDFRCLYDATLQMDGCLQLRPVGRLSKPHQVHPSIDYPTHGNAYPNILKERTVSLLVLKQKENKLAVYFID